MTSYSFSVSFYTLTINILWLTEAARFLAVELMGLEKIIIIPEWCLWGNFFQSDANVCWCAQRNWKPDFTLVCLPVSNPLKHFAGALAGSSIARGHCWTQLWAADFPAVLPSTNSASQPRCQVDRFWSYPLQSSGALSSQLHNCISPYEWDMLVMMPGNTLY